VWKSVGRAFQAARIASAKAYNWKHALKLKVQLEGHLNMGFPAECNLAAA
jgi:hypothetical protein